MKFEAPVELIGTMKICDPDDVVLLSVLFELFCPVGLVVEVLFELVELVGVG